MSAVDNGGADLNHSQPEYWVRGARLWLECLIDLAGREGGTMDWSGKHYGGKWRPDARERLERVARAVSLIYLEMSNADVAAQQTAVAAVKKPQRALPDSWRVIPGGAK